MKPNNDLLTSVEFLELLKDQDGQIHPRSKLNVRGDVIISGERGHSYKDICIENVIFNQSLAIEQQGKKVDTSIRLNSLICHSGLDIDTSKGGSMIIHQCTVDWMHLRRCTYERLCLFELRIQRSLDISGATISRRLEIDEIECHELELISSTGDNHIAAPFVKTKDMIVARQFELARIPVFMSTEMVRKATPAFLGSVAA